MRPNLRVERAEAEIARREVVLLVVERIVGDVHLAVEAEQRAVGVEDGGRVVIEPGGAPLEQRRDDRRRPRSLATLPRRSVVGPGIGSARSNVAASSRLAEVLRAKQLLQADDLRALLGGLDDALGRLVEVLARIEPAAHLHEADRELRGIHGGRIYHCASEPSTKRTSGDQTTNSATVGTASSASSDACSGGSGTAASSAGASKYIVLRTRA